MSYAIELAGRFAREALQPAQGLVVCAAFQRSFYVRSPSGRFACIGERSLGRGPLNALAASLTEIPPVGTPVEVSLANAQSWAPPALRLEQAADVRALAHSAAGRVPDEGLGCLVTGRQNALASHAQPALEAIDDWLAGNSLAQGAAELLGLGPGLTPSGDDYLGGVMVALRAFGRATHAEQLWRWLEPLAAARTSGISGAHLAAAAAGEAHEALHACVAELARQEPAWPPILARLDAVGHCSGWDALAGVAAVARAA